MLTIIFVLVTIKHSMNDNIYILYVTGLARKHADLRQTFSGVTHLHQHTWSITTPTCLKCAYKISQIFSRVEFGLLKNREIHQN